MNATITMARLSIGRFGPELSVCLGLILLFCLFIFPIPPLLLDLALAGSFGVSVFMLMMSVFIVRATDFLVFPTLLLISTLFRLSLNVATTRLILSHGHEGTASAGQVVAAFGNLMMAGSVAIGLVVFCIFMVISFVVVTKGAGRVAEVSARFSLDAMPGKQMAIDADLGSGQITEVEARMRRRALEEESAFFGSMDGAMKFVRGDAIASLIISVINIVGGIAIGVIGHGMPAGQAVATFVTLTVGDGLVSQVPSLLVAVAAGIVVTKAGNEGTAGRSMLRQFSANRAPLWAAAGTCVGIALLPGVPALPFLAIGGLAAWAAWKARAVATAPAEPATDAAARAADEPVGVPPVDPLRLELGAGLLALAAGDAAGLSGQVRALRRQIAAETGVLIPPVRIVDNLSLPTHRYRILLRDAEAGGGEARPGRLLAIGPAGATPPPGAEPVKEPVFQLDAAWIDPAQRAALEVAGNTVVDAPTILATHLSEVVRNALPDLMTQAETQALIEALPPREQRLFTDLVPGKMDMAMVHQTLLTLVRERVSIRDMPLVLEALHDAAGSAGRGLTPARAAARARLRLARQIAQANLSPAGHLAAIIPGPDRERAFHEAMAADPDGPMVLAPDVATPFLDALDGAVAATRTRGDVAVLVVSDGVRAGVRGLLSAWRRDLPVLAASEVPANVRIQVAARI